MRKLGWTVVVIIVLAIVLVIVQMSRSVPAQAAVPAGPRKVKVAGTSALPWPSSGQGAVAIGVNGPIRTSGNETPSPIASLAKLMTAYIVLKDHPLAIGDPGPSITITTADVAAYNADVAQQDSVLQVTAGETLSEQQALEALLVASADNIADVLAQWDAGSVSAFLTKMNDEARALGMDHTHYTDPSGLSSTTTSTASDQLIIARKAMEIPDFATIVAMPAATFPVAGTIQNFNYDIGHDGVIGIKTGSDTSALGCWAFAATRTVAGSPQTVYGVVLGIPGTSQGLIEPALSAGLALANAVPATVHSETVVPAGTTVGYVTAPWRSQRIPVTTVRAISGLVENGTDVTLDAAMPRISGTTVQKGEALGTLTASGVNGVDVTPLRVNGTGSGPSLSWKLTRS